MAYKNWWTGENAKCHWSVTKANIPVEHEALMNIDDILEIQQRFDLDLHFMESRFILEIQYFNNYADVLTCILRSN